MFFISCKETWL